MAVRGAAQVYRHLLRSIPHAVGYQKAATKNIRRLLRSDFEDALKKQTSYEQLVERAGATLLLYLASNRNSKDSNKENSMVHRVVFNVGSLCYHHLSPITRMQPITKKTRIGGSDTKLLRRRRSVQVNKSTTSSSLDSFEVDPGSSLLSPAVEAQVLPSLIVPAKPIRGPKIPTIARRFAASRWDGQRPVPTILTSPAYLTHLQSALDASIEDYERVKEKDGFSAPQTMYMLERSRRRRGELKAAKSKKEEEDHWSMMESEAATLLSNVVNKAQDNCGAWLGASRFTKWAKGEWLPS